MPPSCPAALPGPCLPPAGVTVAFCFYLSVSVTGYSALGDSVPTLVLSGYTGAAAGSASAAVDCFCLRASVVLWYCIGLLLRLHLPLSTLGVLSWGALQLPAVAEAPEWVNVIAFLAIAAHMCSAYQVFAQPVSTVV